VHSISIHLHVAARLFALPRTVLFLSFAITLGECQTAKLFLNLNTGKATTDLVLIFLDSGYLCRIHGA
jgi:hypothetical protein